MGLTNIILESDSRGLIQACWQEKTQGKIKIIVKDILAMKEQFNFCAFTWAPKDANKETHTLARLAAQSTLNRGWSLNPPPQLTSVMQQDIQKHRQAASGERISTT
ncbi:Ribonuclease H superfamily [Sesbania bispinosa]|nr:Ribonuclease H superfamily [Sesbania bispinosa]